MSPRPRLKPPLLGRHSKGEYVPKTIRIFGTVYKVFHRSTSKDAKSMDGWVDYDKKRIYLSEGLSGRRLMETIIHESLHAATVGQVMSEEWVEDVAKDITRFLRRFGFKEVE